MNEWKVRNGYLHSLKVLPHKMLSNHKGKRATLSEIPPRPSDQTRLDQLWDIWHHESRDVMGWDTQQPHFMLLLPKTHNSHSCEQTSNTPNLRDIPLIVFWKAKVTEAKERLRNFSRLKETEETQQLNATGGSEPPPFLSYKGPYWTLVSWYWRLRHGGVGPCPLCGKCTLKCPEGRNIISGCLSNATEGKSPTGNCSVSLKLFLKPAALN